jgi:alpha-tubulin suppressor-like RCC1 family protein
MLSDVATVAAGGLFACALTKAGAIYCWGDGRNGELGSCSVAAPEATPTAVTGFP